MKQKTSTVRERILDTAYKLFYSQGYNLTGINQVIAESGIAKASLYQHFKSKEELCVAYLNKRHHFWMNSFTAYVKNHNDKAGMLEAHFDFLSDMNQKENFRGCAFINLISEVPANNEAIVKVIRDHKSELRDYFKTLVKSLNPLSSKDIADSIYILFEGAILESQIFRLNRPVKVAKDTAVKILNSSYYTLKTI